MTLLNKAGRSLAAARNLASYPIRYRRLGRSWRDGWTALMLRLAASPAGQAVFPAGENDLHLRGLPGPVTLRRLDSDIFVFRDVFESDYYGVVRRLGLPVDANVIDLGANIGLASLFFAGLFPQSRIVALEPDADNLALLRRNCAALCDAGRLTVIPAFAAAHDGTAAIERGDGEQSWAFRKSAAFLVSQRDSIPCLSVPSILAAHPMARIDLLKCDIEGSEAELFAHCAAWIDRVDVLIVDTHAPYTPELLYRDLRAANWEFDVCDQQYRGSTSFLCTLRRRPRPA